MRTTEKRPLDAYPALRSSDVAEIEHVLAATYGSRRFEVIGRRETLAVHANHWQSQAISISFCHYGARADVEFPEAGFFRQQFSLRGGADIKIGAAEREIGPKAFCVVPSDRPLLIRFRPEFEQLVLRIDRERLERKLSALVGGSPAIIEFEPAVHAGNPATTRLSRLLKYLISELDRQEGMTAIEIAELEQAILVTFLQANPHRDSNSLCGIPAGIGARRLQIVEDYIHAHWNEPLSLEVLSAATGVGARNIFHHFRKLRGKTPMQFVKEVRLGQARELLLRAPHLSVTEIAFTCGFGNPGHFAAHYRRRWGERPSETRGRA